MLYFQKIRFKNFLSTGNQFNEVDFTKSRTTLIKGLNGEGKSSIFSALIFVLYGKSNRKTTKTQLVNSINKKDCVVEIEFSSRNKQYKVIRGISPNVFEIWIDNSLQNQDANSKDQQKFLEENILKMSLKTFNQVVLLGSNNFIPFMQLSAQDRRDLVEELLDIKIFSTMNLILKDKIKSIERKLKELSFNYSSTEDKIKMQKEFIETLLNKSNELIEKYNSKIQDIDSEILSINEINASNVSSISEENKKIENVVFSSKKLKQLINIKGKIENKNSILNESIQFFTENDLCPTCKQDLHVEFKNNKIKELENEVDELKKGLDEIDQSILEEEERETFIREITSNISKLTNSISTNNTKILQYQKQKNEYENEIQNIKLKSENQNEESKKLKKLISELKKLKAEEMKGKEALTYFEFSQMLMKDGGIKSKILEKYIPIMNKQINYYLQMMDFYINFTLDEEFKENVKTPIHEDFSYTSFSEGEKQKIDLSILFAWRDIAKMKNSVRTNLLLLDETFDSSLDANGTDYLLKILNYIIKDTNIFVISHKSDDLVDKFERVLEIKKVNGFTKILT